MSRGELKKKLSQDVAEWQADGVISEETAAVLRKRYDTPGFGLITFIKYLGISGGIFLLCGFVGFIGALSGSLGVNGILLLIASAGLFYAGLRMSLDPQARYPYSSKLVLTCAIMTLLPALIMLGHTSGMEERGIFWLLGLVVFPLVFILAYRFQNIFLLILGLIQFFQWVGSFNRMHGRSTYELEIVDPRVMAVVSLAVIAIGTYHELKLKERTLHFYKAYQVLGLLYLNLSLLILSIYPKASAFPYVVLLTLATLGQIVAGARLHNGIFLGFGVTFLAINLYTRFYERFWDSLDKGLFFLLGGLALFGFGVTFEMLSRKSKTEVTA
ncbi:MAG: hypothetical protein U1F57_10200 [bacterium]